MTARRRALGFAFLSIALVATSLTCGDGTGPVADRVVLSGPSVMHPGYSWRFIARVFDAQGNPVSNTTPAWTSSATDIATVDANGIVSALALGEATIAATYQNKRAELVLSVTPAPVASVIVTPALDSMLIGDSVLLAVELCDSGGRVLTGRAVTWAVSDSVKATLRPSGWVIAHTAESFAVAAMSEGVAGGAFLMGQYAVASLTLPDSITITRYDTAQLVPDVRSATGTRLSGRATTWSTPDSGVLSVRPLTGVFTARALGEGRIIAASFGHVDTSRVRVVPESVATVVVHPLGALQVAPGGTMRFRTDVRDSSGRPIAGRVPSWGSSDTNVVRVVADSLDPSTGVATGVAPGYAAVSATVAERTASIQVEVRSPIAALVLKPDSLAVRVGVPGIFTAVFADSLGNLLYQAIADFASGDTTVATVDGSGEFHPLRPGRVTVTGKARVNGMTATAIVVVRATLMLRWDNPDISLLLPTPDTIEAFLDLDSAGAANSTPVDLKFEVNDTSVAEVSPTVASGATQYVRVILKGKRNGAASVVASNDSVFAVKHITVVEMPIGSVSLKAPDTVLTLGDTATLAVSTLDRNGQPRPYPVTWASTDPAVATVSQTGVVRALAAGPAAITASSGVLSDTSLLIVRSTNAPVLDSVRPSLLLAGGAGAIYGANFDPDPARNDITLDGVPVTVTGATATRLTFQVPPATSLPCSPSHLGRLIVSSGGRVETIVAPFADAPQRTLGVGQALILGTGEDRCNELTESGRYYIALVNTSPSADAVTSLELRGEAAAVLPTPPVAETAAPPPPGATRLPAAESPAPAALAAARRAFSLHRRVLEGSRRLALAAGAPAPLLRAGAAATGPQPSAADTIGNLARIRVPRIDYPDFCSRYQAVTARRAFTGQHVVIFEDNAAPLAGTMDAVYEQIGNEFDTVMFPQLVAAFGDPLVLDSLLDRNDRIVMLFTPLVNAWGIGGFVTSCDFYPETVAPSSNTGEIFYGAAPIPVPPGFPLDAATYWRWRTRTVVMHEGKHLAAYAQRLSRGAPLEEVWLEEGSAVLAEELWSRGVYRTAWKGDATYRQTLFCDVRPDQLQCNGRPYSMFNAFAFLYDFATPARRHSPLGWTSDDDVTFYGSAWSLLRWATDQYAPDEDAFLRALVQDPSRTGVANLEAHTGRPFADLVTDWFLASLADNLAGVTAERPELSHPSWNTRDVFLGMSNDFPEDFPYWFPFAFFFPESQTFLQPVDVVRGGSAALFDLTSSQAGQLLELRAWGGGAPDPALRVAILRIE